MHILPARIAFIAGEPCPPSDTNSKASRVVLISPSIACLARHVAESATSFPPLLISYAAALPASPPSSHSTMANSSYEYVKHFELPDTLLPSTWLVIRVDGQNFHSASPPLSNWEKPNDVRQLHLMNASAQRVMSEYSDITIAIGMSPTSSASSSPPPLPSSTAVVISWSPPSPPSSPPSYTFLYPTFFPSPPLPYPSSLRRPHHRAIPTDQHLRDYLSWRQVDCSHQQPLQHHLLGAYVNQSFTSPATQAHARLSDGTDSAL